MVLEETITDRQTDRSGEPLLADEEEIRSRAVGFIDALDAGQQPAWKSTMFVEGRSGHSSLAGWKGLAWIAPTVAGLVAIGLAIMAGVGW